MSTLHSEHTIGLHLIDCNPTVTYMKSRIGNMHLRLDRSLASLHGCQTGETSIRSLSVRHLPLCHRLSAHDPLFINLKLLIQNPDPIPIAKRRRCVDMCGSTISGWPTEKKEIS